MTTIMTLVGSLRAKSFNGRLMTLATDASADLATFEPFTLLGDIPPFNQDTEDNPVESVVRLREQIVAADGVLIANPEYNGSITGVLKNALDWASRPYDSNSMREKPVAIIGASPSRGGAERSMGELRFVLGRIGAKTVDAHVTVPRAFEALDDPELPSRLREVVAELVNDLHR